MARKVGQLSVAVAAGIFLADGAWSATVTSRVELQTAVTFGPLPDAVSVTEIDPILTLSGFSNGDGQRSVSGNLSTTLPLPDQRSVELTATTDGNGEAFWSLTTYQRYLLANDGPDAAEVSLTFDYELFTALETGSNAVESSNARVVEASGRVSVVRVNDVLDGLFDQGAIFFGQTLLSDSTESDLDNGFLPSRIEGSEGIDLLIASGETVGLAVSSIFDADVAPVPIPAAGWVLLAGIGALGALRGRRVRYSKVTETEGVPGSPS